jgi:hypothetical protein
MTGTTAGCPARPEERQEKERLPLFDNAHIPNGRILSGAGRARHNAPWSWHLDPVDIQMAEAAIEVCDATPSYVEAHRDYFVGVVGRY